MSQQKQKFSLTDFLKDKSLGGDSWADDDFDPSSISLPTHTHNLDHNYLTYQGNSSRAFGNSNRYNNSQGPSSPPYIVKISNIPSSYALQDLEEIFHCRFMKFNKLKLFWEIDHAAYQENPNPLDAINFRKKVAFVELETYQESEKVLKWSNLYLERGMGRLMINVGNFNDFKTYNDLNQQVPENLDPSFPSQNNSRFGPGPSIRHQRNSFSLNQPSHHAPPQHSFQHGRLNQNQELSENELNHHIKPNEAHELPPLIQPKPASMSKSNPFGKAKPVDILKKDLELSQKLESLQINKTTFKTLGTLEHEEKAKSLAEKNQEGKKQTIASKPDLSLPNESSKTETLKPVTSPTTHHQKLAFKKQESKAPAIKPTSFTPALEPQVQAWSSTPILNADSTNSSNNNSPTQPFAKLSSPSLMKNKLKNDSNHKLDEKGKKTILRRKVVDHKKPKIGLKKDASPSNNDITVKNGEESNKVEQTSKAQETQTGNQDGNAIVSSPQGSKEEEIKEEETRASNVRNQQNTSNNIKKNNGIETKSQVHSQSAVDSESAIEKSQEPQPELRKTEIGATQRPETDGFKGRGRGRGRGRTRGRPFNEREGIRNTEIKPDEKPQEDIHVSSINVEKNETVANSKDMPKIPAHQDPEDSNSWNSQRGEEETFGARGRGRGFGRGRGGRGRRPRGRGGYPNLSRVYNRKNSDVGGANTGENASTENNAPVAKSDV